MPPKARGGLEFLVRPVSYFCGSSGGGAGGVVILSQFSAAAKLFGSTGPAGPIPARLRGGMRSFCGSSAGGFGGFSSLMLPSFVVAVACRSIYPATRIFRS